MGLRNCLFVLLITSIECINWEKLQKFPSPQKHFDINKYAGSWYYMASLPPCSHAGSSKFTNSVTQYYVQPDGSVTQNYIFRSILCTTVEVTKKTNGRPGIYVNKDHIGNPTSGPNVILVTDYNRFSISWGCTKLIGDRCQDVYLYVKTRRRKPKPTTWKIIESILRYLYDIEMTDLHREIHDENACLTFEETPQHATTGEKSPYDRLRKIYRK